MLFILIQLLILKKDFRPIQFLQIAANILFSFFIDVSMTLLTGLNPQTIPLRSLSLLVGCAILAVGISVEVAPDIIKVPGEGIVHAMATLLSFLFFHKLNGIGLGTIISAVLVGPMISFVNRHLPGIGKIRALANRR